MDEEFEEGKAYRSTYSEEMAKRTAHMESLPGATFKNDLDALNLASYVLSGNGLELTGHIQRFVDSLTNVRNLENTYKNELVRLLHNYLTSVSSLIDAQRVVVRHIWPEQQHPERRSFESDFDEKRRQTFESGEAAFVTKLRNYCTHYAIPVPGLGTTLSWSALGPVLQVNSLQLDRDKLLRWGGWRSAAKRYLSKQSDQFDLAPIIERYMASTGAFYEWFWYALHERNSPAVDEFMQKGEELSFWAAEFGQSPGWFREGRERPSGWRARRFRAELRIERFAHGTRGYVVHSITPDGVITHTEDPWGPFPNRT